MHNTDLIIMFINDERKYILSIDKYEKYEKSLFYLHKKFHDSNTPLVLQNMTYDQFAYVFDFLNNKYVNTYEIKELLDYLGLYDFTTILRISNDKELLHYCANNNDMLNKFIAGES